MGSGLCLDDAPTGSWGSGLQIDGTRPMLILYRPRVLVLVP